MLRQSIAGGQLERQRSPYELRSQLRAANQPRAERVRRRAMPLRAATRGSTHSPFEHLVRVGDARHPPSTARYTGQISFSTMPDASIASIPKVGQHEPKVVDRDPELDRCSPRDGILERFPRCRMPAERVRPDARPGRLAQRAPSDEHSPVARRTRGRRTPDAAGCRSCARSPCPRPRRLFRRCQGVLPAQGLQPWSR